VGRAPGGPAAGARARARLKAGAVSLARWAALRLFLAARALLVTVVTRPAIEAGRDVVCDRFGDSSVAYQGHARGLGTERVEELCDLATGGLWPDLTLLLRLHPEVAAERIAAEGRAADRFEGEGMELQRRVAEGYEEVTRRHPDRVRVVDASGDPDEVHAAVIRELQAVGAVE
jgi:dTMP kinase